MTVCKVALANLAMWVRDDYFPPSYQLPGTITQNSPTIQVERCPLNERVLNWDLALLCERVQSGVASSPPHSTLFPSGWCRPTEGVSRGKICSMVSNDACQLILSSRKASIRLLAASISAFEIKRSANA